MKICFKEDPKIELNSYFKRLLKDEFNTSSSNSLIINLRKMWIGSYEFAPWDRKKGKMYSFLFQMEFYLKNDSCIYPLYRIDTVHYVTGINIEKLMSGISDVLNISLEKISTIDLQNIYTRKCLSENSIDSFNQSRKNFAVLKENIPAKGVFLTFDQFRNNQPRFRDFDMKLDSKADAIYVKSKKGIDSLITDAWGFSDGEKAYIRIGYNYFPLFRNGDNFDLYAFDKVVIQQPFAGMSAPIIRDNYNAFNTTYSLIGVGIAELLSYIKISNSNLRPYQLDTETGQLY